MERLLGTLAILLLAVETMAAATAGSLRIVSWYSGTITCNYGPGDYPTGPVHSVKISYGAPWVYAPAPGSSIDWLVCGNALARHMSITPTSPDHTIVISGFPQRALNVLLYTYLPSNPNGNFATMQALIAVDFATYGDPNVMLNAVLTSDPRYDIYTASNYNRIFGLAGFDVVESDMIMLPQILAGNYIRPWTGLQPSAFWRPGVDAVTWGGQIWGVPSCRAVQRSLL